MAVNSINTNIAAYFAQSNIGVASDAAAKSVARLSSGNRIISASDDVAALATGTSLRINVATLSVARINASQGASVVQVADGGLSQITDILARQKAIALQAGSGSLSDSDRVFLNQEFQALKDEIDRIVTSTNFNGVKLLDGSLSGSNDLRSGNGGTATVAGLTAQGTAITAAALTDASGTAGDNTFIGDLSAGVFSVTSDGGTGFTVTYTINGSTYSGFEADITSTGGSIVLSNGEGTLTFTVAANLTSADASISADAAGATYFTTLLTDAFSGATAFANRAVLSTDATGFTGSAIKTTDTEGTLFQGLTGADVIVSSQYFNGYALPTISDFAAIGTFGIGTKFQVTVNGRTYITGALADATDLASSGAPLTSGAANNALRFYLDGDSTTNPNEYIQIDLSNVQQTVDFDTQEGVNAGVNTLNDLFGRSGGGLSFQVGVSTTDTIGVSVGDVSTSTLYAGATLTVSTQTAAATASTALDTAIATVTSRRADVGALQSRFNFAAANIENSIQNQDAARAGLLDADIATESTAYATAQVKLQAGISVLAQANQQLQSLLKLIG